MSWLSKLQSLLRVPGARKGKRIARRCQLSLESLERRELLSGNTFHLDLGTLKSPVATAYTGLPLDSYSGSRGYGWQSTMGMSAVNRNSANGLTQDMHVGTSGIFLVDVPNGTYDVGVTLGDPGAKRDNVSIWAEGAQVGTNLTTLAGQILQPNYRVSVADGQLTLRFVDGGGVNNKFAVDAIDVTPAVIANAGPNKSGNEGSSISFSGSATGGTGTYTYSWNFGDSGTATGANVSHVFNDNGSYTVTLTVTDSAGKTHSDTALATIANVAPSGNAGGPYSGQAGQSVSFSATITDPSSVDTAAGFTYSWKFGDGGTSTLAAPTHVYTAGGSYTVTLTVKDKDNGTFNTSTSAQISSGNIITVHNIGELQAAVTNLASGQTVVLVPGTYQLPDTLYLPQNLSNVTFRGQSGNASDVVVRGNGMAGTVTFGFWLGNVQNATFADMTIRDLSQHGIILNAGVQSPVFRNLQIIDIGDQFIKANPDGLGGGVNNGLVENCLFLYTTTAPDYYTNGVDVHTGANWIIRNNTFKNFRAVGALAGPAVLMWNGSSGSITEGNTFINNARDIAYGLGDVTPNDHTGGIIRNNFIERSSGVGGDVAIGVFDSPNTEVLHNTVQLNGNYPNAIEYRFLNTTGVVIKNNLTDAAIISRDGATATLAGNLTNAQNSWFVNPAAADLHLTTAATPAIDAVPVLTDAPKDIDGQSRPIGPAADIGADEYQAGPPDTIPPTVSITAPSNGATVSGTITVSANASDNVGVVGVRFYVDGSVLGAEDMTSPYSISWDTTTVINGQHTLTAKARDAAGNSATSSAVTVTVFNAAPPPGNGQAPLLYQENFQYVGAFRVPGGNFGSSTFDYGGTALAYNPTNNSLFMVGHDWDQAVAEISIPTAVNSTQLGNLNTAAVLQPFVSVLGKVPNNTLAGRNVKVGGLTVVGGQLIGTAYDYYDGAGTAVDSHFKLNSLNLATAGVTGYFQVGTLGGGYVGGYMTPIPTEWQAALGSTYLTGQAALNIISRTSSGPAAFGFDPNNLGPSVTPITPYVYYPVATPLGDIGVNNPLFTGNTEIKGVLFAPGTRSVLFFGDNGTNTVGYGEPATFNDNNRGGKGWHSVNGDYAYEVWAYKVDDFVAVKNGTKQPWDIKPYETWYLNLPFADGSKHLGGVAFDPATGKLYISQMYGDTLNFAYKPVVYVFQLTPAMGSVKAPKIGSLTATPNPATAGSNVTLTASDVQAFNLGSSIVLTRFYLDLNGDRVLELGVDRSLGTGTQSGASWQLTFSTAGLGAGTYTVFAQAQDSAGLFSDIFAITLTIV